MSWVEPIRWQITARLRVFIERDGRYPLVRVFGAGRWPHSHAEIAYLALRWCGPLLEWESPSDWHEERRAWLRIGLGFGLLAFSWRWRGKVPADEGQCSGPTWGFRFAEDALWIYHGKSAGRPRDGSRTVLYYPWSWVWVSTHYLSPDRRVYRQQRRHEYHAPPEIQEQHLYHYRLRSGQVQQVRATIHGTRMEWRWRALKWLPWPRFVTRSIDVHFDGEVGERTGSWKGGVMGCSWPWRHGETMEAALRRMEREQVFD